MNCVCGHVDDEHELGGRECTIDDCGCVMFELGDEDEDED